MNEINFLKPKSLKNPGRPGFLKLLVVYFIAFSVVLVVLNVSSIADTANYIRNQFSDRNEVLETELLQASIHHEEPTLTPFAREKTEEQNSIYIPKINVKAPIIEGGSTNSNKLLKELESGVVMYPGSAQPGRVGSTVIVGHSSSNSPWNKYSNVFSLLNRLSSGDLVYINYGGSSYAYQVNNKKTGSVFSLANADIGGDLVLSSCWPVGSDKGRILVSATLIR